MIRWDKVTEKEWHLISEIAKRARAMCLPSTAANIQFGLDIPAAHVSGAPLRLADLLAANDYEFSHDVFGIVNHIDRETGALQDGFSPRFSAHGSVPV